MKSIDDHRIKLMTFLDDTATSQAHHQHHHFMKNGQSQQPGHGQHFHPILMLHPLTSSLITLVIVVTLFWMMVVSSACSENGLSELHKRSSGRGSCPVAFHSMCESCAKVTRSTVVYYKCCKDHLPTVEYCIELLGLGAANQQRSRRDLRPALPAIWIRLLKRR